MVESLNPVVLLLPPVMLKLPPLCVAVIVSAPEGPLTGAEKEKGAESLPRPVGRRAGGRRRGRQSEGHDLLQAVARPGE